MWKTCSAILALTMGLGAAPLHAQSQAAPATWPNQPVRLVVPFPAGGGVDNLARQLAESLAGEWGQSVVVVNRPGGSTIVGTNSVINANDNHTLLFTTDATFSMVAKINPNAQFALGKDLDPVALVAEFNQMLVGKPEFAADSLPELLAKGKAGHEFTYASYGSGSEPQLAIEMLKHLSGVDIRHIPYKGVPQALNAVVAGEVDFTTSGTKTIEPLVQSGKLTPLAFTGPQRDDLFPNVRTFTELGMPEVNANVVIGLFAPTALPAEARTAVQQGVAKALANEALTQRAIIDRGFIRPTFAGDNLMPYFDQRAQQRAKVIEIADIRVE